MDDDDDNSFGGGEVYEYHLSGEIDCTDLEGMYNNYLDQDFWMEAFMPRVTKPKAGNTYETALMKQKADRKADADRKKLLESKKRIMAKQGKALELVIDNTGK